MENRIWEREGEESLEHRIAAKAHAVMLEVQERYRKFPSPSGFIVPNIADIRTGIVLELQLAMLQVRQEVYRSILEEEAQRQGQQMFIVEQIFDLQKEIDILNWKIAKKNRPDDR